MLCDAFMVIQIRVHPVNHFEIEVTLRATTWLEHRCHGTVQPRFLQWSLSPLLQVLLQKIPAQIVGNQPKIHSALEAISLIKNLLKNEKGV